MGLTRMTVDLPVISEHKRYTETNLEAVSRYRFLNGEVALFTHVSPDKTGANEDAMALVPAGRQQGALIVADGVGGHAASSEAARLAVDNLIGTLSRTSDQYVMREAILDGIENANKAVLEMRTGAAATLAVVEIDGHTARPYHVGDALILITGQRGRVKFQNIPHSPVGYAVESGLIDADEAVHHEERNIVSNVIGDTTMRIEIGPTISLGARDSVLVSSDAVSDNLYANEIIAIIRAGPLHRAAQKLVTSCRQRMASTDPGTPGHPDDMSFILFRSLVSRRAGKQG